MCPSCPRNLSTLPKQSLCPSIKLTVVVHRVQVYSMSKTSKKTESIPVIEILCPSCPGRLYVHRIQVDCVHHIHVDSVSIVSRETQCPLCPSRLHFHYAQALRVNRMQGDSKTIASKQSQCLLCPSWLYLSCHCKFSVHRVPIDFGHYVLGDSVFIKSKETLSIESNLTHNHRVQRNSTPTTSK